jgi:hypothetical protein
LIAFREWASDRLFYERLVDGEEHAVATFEREKALIDAKRKSPATRCGRSCRP